MIPAHARAELLVRLVGPSAPIRELLAAAVVPGVRITFPTELPCFKASSAAPAGWETTVVSYASDLPFYETWGARYQLGPGTIRVAHTDQERIAKADLTEGVARYVRLARELLAGREAPTGRRMSQDGN